MKNFDGCKRGFYHTGAAWYAPSALATQRCSDPAADEIVIGMYHSDGGTMGEFAIRWMTVGHKATPRLEVFNDAWQALAKFPDLLELLANHDGQNITPEKLCTLLVNLGLWDKTERVRA